MTDLIRDVNGNPIDLSGPEEAPAPSIGGPAVNPRNTTFAQDVPDPVMGAVNQFTWGFNSMLFALPDAAVAELGRQMRVPKEKIPSMVKMFNRGDSTPRNAVERYSRALGEGAAGTLPITGLSLGAARLLPATTAAMTAAPEASLMKEIAKNAIEIYQKSPVKAAAVDIAFGAGFEGLRQAVEESVDDSNPNKAILKEAIPTAAFVGLPLAVSLSPSAWAFRKGKEFIGKGAEKQQATQAALGEVGKEVLEQEIKDNFLYGVPPFKIIPSVIIGRAEKKLQQVFKDIETNPAAQDALKQLEDVLNDPKIKDLNFQFGVSERYMDPALLQRQRETMEKMGPQELEAFRTVYNNNHEKLNKLFDAFAPEARQHVEEAFMAAQSRRQQFFDDLLRQKQDLTESERAMLAQRLGPQNIDRMNDEVRGLIQSDMEMDHNMRQGILRKMGLKQGISPEGLPEPTRENGVSLFPAKDMEAAAMALIKKYKPERPSERIHVPEPIARLERFVKGQQVAREKMETQMLDQLLTQQLDQQLSGSKLFQNLQLAEQQGLTGKGLSEKEFRKTINALIKRARDPKSLTKEEKTRIQNELDFGKELKDGTIELNMGRGEYFRFNPKQMIDDAARIAEANTAIDINVPEALDYFRAAQRYRNDSLGLFNAAQRKGSVRATDAQRYMDSGDAVYRDIKQLIMDHVPKIKQEYQGMKMVIDDYESAYGHNLPLLMTQKTRGGRNYYLPNEDLMHQAFKNTENLRQLQALVGNNPQGKELLEKGAIDWMARKNIYTAEGLIDPKKMRREIERNKNIIEALPASIQMKYQDELKMADDLAVRMGELDARRVAAKDNELESVLQKASRQDADPQLALDRALRDPATMRSLVNELGKDPENLAALRRSVYDMAQPLIQNGQSLEAFMRQNEKSLKVLFGKEGHYENLLKLANLQRRAEAFSDVVGQVPVFDTTDQLLQRAAGVSIPYVSTTIRNVGMRHISPETAAIAVFTRLLNAKENKIYNRLFTKAMEDPEFAKKITRIESEEGAKPVIKTMEGMGLKPSFWTTAFAGPRTMRAAKTELGRLARDAVAEDQQQQEAPAAVPRETAPVNRGPSASQMLRQLPAAPASRGMPADKPQPRLPTATPQPPANFGMQTPQMYPALFPNDPISSMMMMRQQQPR